MHTVGDTAGIADQAGGRRMLADADQDAVAGGPRASDRMRLHVRQQLIVDPLRGPPQRELTQSGQVAGLEIVPGCPFGLMRHVDLALVQALDQIVRGDVDDFDVVGLVENAVGHGLAHPDAGDSCDDIVEALDVLDVQRRVDIDAGGDQFLDIEIALRMTAAGRVGVRQFIDQNELRPTLEDRVEIDLGEAMAVVFDLAPRNDFEVFEQRLGLAPAMRLDHADDQVDALAPLGLRRLQHLIGLADTRCGAEENF